MKCENIIVDEKYHDIHYLINIARKLDFAVSVPYYSHIFCTITGTSFLSISCDKNII